MKNDHTIPCLDVVFDQRNTHVRREHIHELALKKSFNDFKSNYLEPNSPYQMVEVPEFQEILTSNTNEITYYSTEIRRLITVSNICVYVNNYFEKEWSNAMYLTHSNKVIEFFEKIKYLTSSCDPSMMFLDVLQEYYIFSSNLFQEISQTCKTLDLELKDLFDLYLYDSNVSSLCISYLYS